MSERWVLLKGNAGLGNRLEALASAILLARVTGRRLAVDWSDATYSGDRSNVFPRLLRCASVDPGAHPPETDSVAPALWRGRLAESVLEVGPGLAPRALVDATSIDVERVDYSERVVVFWCYGQQVDALRPRFRGSLAALAERPTSQILRDVLREEVSLQPPLQAEVEAFRRERCPGPTIGVHVRWSDHRSQLQPTLARLDKLLRKRSELGIFLATDGREIRTLFERRYPRVVSRDHWFPAAGLPIHGNPADPDPARGAADALIDLELLTRCEAVIADKSSSFGFLALVLSNAPAGAVYRLGQREKGPMAWHHRRYQALRALGFFSWGPRLVRASEDARQLGRRLRAKLR